MLGAAGGVGLGRAEVNCRGVAATRRCRGAAVGRRAGLGERRIRIHVDNSAKRRHAGARGDAGDGSSSALGLGSGRGWRCALPGWVEEGCGRAVTGRLEERLKGGMLSAIAAGLLACSPPSALADPTLAPTNPGPGVTTPAPPAISTAPNAAVTAAPVAPALTTPPIPPTTPTAPALAPALPPAPAATWVVPSGTYPLAASAPLPSEAKKIQAAAEAAAAAAARGDSKPQSQKSAKEIRSGRLEELNTLRLELDLKELEVGVYLWD